MDSRETMGGAQNGVPKKHFIIGLCVLLLVGIGWLFRAEVRGLASFAIAAARGEPVPLAAAAPGLAALLRGDTPYTADEFLALCEAGNEEAVAALLRNMPELPVPGNGATMLHTLAARSIEPGILAMVLRAAGREDVNVRDAEGRTALHVAAGSRARPGTLLLLRGMGADVTLRDNAGRLALDHLMETWGGMPRSVTSAEERGFSRYGHTVPVPFSGISGDGPKTKFVPLADQVPTLEGKRYFSLLAEAGIAVRDSGFTMPPMAAGDQVGPPPNPEADLLRKVAQPTARKRERAAEPLWKMLALADGTGGAMAKLKCMLPEAYPESIGYFSERLAGKEDIPPYAVEWHAWDVPVAVQFALLMETLQQRLPAKPGVARYGVGGRPEYAEEATRIFRERGDSPQARDPLLMTWMLLEYGEGLPEKAVALNLSPSLPAGEDKKRTGGESASPEFTNLLALRAALPREAWFAVGRQMVAAAYVADKRRQGQGQGKVQGLAQLMPQTYRQAGGLAFARTWGCEDRADQAEPMRRVLETAAGVSPDLATAMVALLLRSGPESTAPGKDGKTPLETARDHNAPEPVLRMLAAAAAGDGK